MALTSWDSINNSFVHNTSDVYASRDGVTGGVAQGGAFATSEIAQTVAVPAGYEYGELRVEFARGNDADVLADDTGEVVIEALDAEETVAATLVTTTDLDDQVATDGTDWTATLTATPAGALGNDVTLSVWFALGTPASVEVRDGERYNGSTWDADAGNVGVLVIANDAGETIRVGDIQSEINSESALASVTTGDPSGTKLVNMATMDGVEAFGSFTGGITSTVLASATTGAESFTPRAEFTRRRLSLALPDNTTYVRTRLIADRSLGAGNSGALFADFSARIFKDLDPAYVWDFDFSAPALQSLPSSYQHYHLDYPDHPVPIVWGGTNEEPSAIASDLDADATHAWSDDPVAHTPAKFVAHLATSGTNAAPQTAISTDAYRFARAIAAAAVDLQSVGAYGKFTSAASFSVAIPFRVRELALSAACGLAGDRDNTGIGWGLGISAAGLLTFTIQGATGTAVATGTVDVRDRAPRWVVATYDHTTDTLTLHDGGTPDTDATATGEFETATDVPFRIGRDGPASATGDVDIARVYLYDEVLTADQVGELMTFGSDPTELGLSWLSSHPVWVAGPDDEDGATLVRYADDQIPIAHHPTIDAGSAGYGAAHTSAKPNLVPTNDLAAAAWTVSGATRAIGAVDPTGLPLGAEITIVNAGTDYLQLAAPVGGAGTLRLVVWLRTTDDLGGGNYDLEVEVRADDGSATLKATLPVVVTEQWQRFELDTAGWDDAVNDVLLRLVLEAAAGAGATYEIGHVAWLGLDEDYPLAIQDAGATITATSGLLLEALPRQLNHEGELYAEGVCSMASPAVGVRLAAVDNDTDDVNRRELTISTGAAPALSLHDATGVEDETLGPAIADWRAPFAVRGRWNRLDLPETTGNTVGVVGDAGETYDSVAFTIAAAAGAAIRTGNGLDALLRRVRVTSREPKLV